MNFDEEIREFLIESAENLVNLDRELVQLEQNPEDPELISSAFRTIHTIKGTCGFFGFDILSAVTHLAENILSQVRERQRVLTPDLISLILEAVDAIKLLLAQIESTGSEGEDQTKPLLARLEKAQQMCTVFGAHIESSQNSASLEGTPVARLMTEQLRCENPRTVHPSTVAESSLHRTADQIVAKEVEGPSAGSEAARPLGEVKSMSESSFDNGILGADLVYRTPFTDAVATLKDDSLRERIEAAESTKDATSEVPIEGAREAQLTESTIRVDVGLLNRLMNLVGELVLARNQLLQDTSAQNSSLQQTSQRLNLITSELQEGVMKTRMQPIGVVWNKLPRVVRDLAAKCGKKVHIEMEGAGTELDKTIIEAIKDPLTHIVRNSCDHGIEAPEIRVSNGKSPQGLLLLRAYHEGGVVNIEISDDGAGIDAEKVKAKAIEKGLIRSEQAAQMSTRDALHLIFMAGFSTAAQVTSISGRGVGMDVVKTNIEKIGGNVEVLNRAEGGTTIRIKIPLTLAIIPGLVVTLTNKPEEEQSVRGPKWNKEERFIIPQANLLELVRLEGGEETKRIESVHGTPVFHHRGRLLPLVYLGKVLGRPESSEPVEAVNIIVLQAENRQLGLVVDQICDTQEIVVKPLGRQLKGLICYVGATIMGDGRPALIIDVAGLSRLAGLGAQSRQGTQTNSTNATTAQPQMMLLFRAGRYERLAVPLALVDRLEEVNLSKIERAAGQTVLYYRDNILPLVSLAKTLDSTAGETSSIGDTAQIIVFANGHRRVGLIVDQIVDIVNETITVRRANPAPGLLGSAVIAGKITDLIDLHGIALLSGDNWLDGTPDLPVVRPGIILVDPSPVAREMINEFLGFSGYEVIQASTVAEALPKIRHSPAAVLISAQPMSSADQNQLRSARSKGKSLAGVPVLGLIENGDKLHSISDSDDMFDGRIVRSERDALLKSLAALLHQTTLQIEATR